MSVASVRPIAVLLLFGVFVGGGATCSSASDGGEPAPVSGPTADTLLATVDTVQAPDRIAPTDTLRVRLRGMVGPNGCYSLARIDTERASGRVVLRPIVRHREQGMCTMAIVSLDEIITLAPPHPEEIVRIVVPQTDRPAVRATVRVGGDDEADSG